MFMCTYVHINNERMYMLYSHTKACLCVYKNNIAWLALVVQISERTSIGIVETYLIRVSLLRT